MCYMDAQDFFNFDNTYARLPGNFHSPVTPTPLKNPYLISFNQNVADLIGLHCSSEKNTHLINAFKGIELLPQMKPIAAVYAGHQFGSYVPRLGDGRAILLGEIRDHYGDSWDLQLKGAGLTPFSRDGDGRAVLRSTIREYLCGEAMHGLNIPTTRALCMFGSDEPVYRESIETGALLVRVARSHVRFGTFEYFYYTNQHQQLYQLADHVIAEHFPEIATAKSANNEHTYSTLLETVIAKTAKLIAQWQTVGFAHGVMNTDNMSVLGLTIDYGPFGFLDTYNPGFICNHSDHYGRYAFDRQSDIGLFNLSCFAQALLPLLSENPEEAAEKAKGLLGQYTKLFEHHFFELARQKLGLVQSHGQDLPLYNSLLTLLADNHVDFTRFFRALNRFKTDSGNANHHIRDMFLEREAFDQWAERYIQRLQMENSIDQERKQRMDKTNPKYVLRNYLAEIAIQKATSDKDYSEIETLMRLVQNPFDEHPELEKYSAEPPHWAQHIEVSCSS